MTKLTNDELYRKLLLEWFDATQGSALLNMTTEGAERRNELKHLISECRPAGDKEAAGDLTYAKLVYDKPEREIGLEGRLEPLLIKIFMPQGWKKAEQ